MCSARSFERHYPDTVRSIVAIKPKNLIVTTRECGPKEAPIPEGRYGTVLRVTGRRYFVMFGGTPETIRQVWLHADDIKRP